jgi:hypothetical protein
VVCAVPCCAVLHRLPRTTSSRTSCSTQSCTCQLCWQPSAAQYRTSCSKSLGATRC